MSIRAARRCVTVALAFALFVPVQQAWANEKETARNKAIVRDFYTTVLIGRDVDAPRFLRPDYIQHVNRGKRHGRRIRAAEVD
jgi:hypothetical protein